MADDDMRVPSAVIPAPAGPQKLRCPHCGHLGVFHGHEGSQDLSWQVDDPESDQSDMAQLARALKVLTRSWIRTGIRICPNPDCVRLVFVVTKRGELIKSFPPETIDFDASSIPEKVSSSLKEAILCHAAGAHRAAALMVRRTLEEFCEERGVRGRDLMVRLNQLGASLLISQDLLEGANELRLLGNDAAHLEARHYDSVGSEESLLAIELTKELLKAAYQQGNLARRLRGLKEKNVPPTERR